MPFEAVAGRGPGNEAEGDAAEVSIAEDFAAAFAAEEELPSLIRVSSPSDAERDKWGGRDADEDGSELVEDAAYDDRGGNAWFM